MALGQGVKGGIYLPKLEALQQAQLSFLRYQG